MSVLMWISLNIYGFDPNLTIRKIFILSFSGFWAESKPEKLQSRLLLPVDNKVTYKDALDKAQERTNRRNFPWSI